MTLELGTVCITRTKCRRIPYSPNKRMHWAERARWTKAWQEEVFYRLRGTYPQVSPAERVILTLTFYTTRPQDFDNTIASSKAIIDGLKGYAIKDDNAAHCEMNFKIEKVEHKTQEHVKIQIQPL